MLSTEKQAEYDRLQAAKEEAKAIAAWKAAGEQGNPPPTPNLDAIKAKETPPASTEAEEAPEMPKGTITANRNTTTDRLPAGALRDMVLEFIRRRGRAAEAKEGFGPTTIATKLERSSGAVRNACDRLVDDGLLKRTNDKPLRYALVAKGKGR